MSCGAGEGSRRQKLAASPLLLSSSRSYRRTLHSCCRAAPVHPHRRRADPPRPSPRPRTARSHPPPVLLPFAPPPPSRLDTPTRPRPLRTQMSLQSAAPVVIDGKGHLLGRLASIVAKQLLNGQKVVVVRCELINASGSFFRAKVSHCTLLSTHGRTRRARSRRGGTRTRRGRDCSHGQRGRPGWTRTLQMDAGGYGGAGGARARAQERAKAVGRPRHRPGRRARVLEAGHLSSTLAC